MLGVTAALPLSLIALAPGRTDVATYPAMESNLGVKTYLEHGTCDPRDLAEVA